MLSGRYKSLHFRLWQKCSRVSGSSFSLHAHTSAQAGSHDLLSSSPSSSSSLSSIFPHTQTFTSRGSYISTSSPKILGSTPLLSSLPSSSPLFLPSSSPARPAQSSALLHTPHAHFSSRRKKKKSKGRDSAQTEVEQAVLCRGRVVGNFGGRFLVEDIARVLRDGYESREENRHSCVPKGSIKAYCGDYVLFRRPILEGEGDGVVYRVIPRENIFQRSDKQCRGGLEAVCSNVDQICVVVTVRPNMNAFLVDRILSQAMRMGAGACIVLNKVDLIPELLQAEAHTSQRAFENFTQALVETEVILTDFQRIGYPVIRTSAVTGEGVQDLVQFLAGASEASVQAREMGQRGPHTPQNTDEQSQEHYRWIKQAYPFPTSVFIGQSGVGKSSLLNCVMPSLGIKTRNVWRRSGQGKHTTSNTLLHYLEDRTDDVRVEADVDHDRTASDDSDGGAEVGGEDLEGMEEHDEGKGRVGESEEKGKVARENEEGEGEYDICDDVNNDDHDDSDDSGDEEREEEVEEVEEVEEEEEEDDDEDEEDWYYEEEQPVLFEYQDLGSTKADIIDSPGFQNYLPVPIPANQVQHTFIEMLEPATLCKYRNCEHHKEALEDCGVRRALAEGGISERRFESFSRLMDTMDEYQALRLASRHTKHSLQEGDKTKFNKHRKTFRGSGKSRRRR